jgi:hypothetical protein
METESKAEKPKNKKRVIVKTLVFLLVLLFIAALIPQKLRYKDGGTVEYKAVLYSVTKWHAFAEGEEPGEYFRVGTTVKILGRTVSDDRRVVPAEELNN